MSKETYSFNAERKSFFPEIVNVENLILYPLPEYSLCDRMTEFQIPITN